MNSNLTKSALAGVLLLALTVLPSVQASWLSKSVLNTQNTVNKAIKDTNAEIDRSKEKLLNTSTHGSGQNTPFPSPSPVQPLASPLPAPSLASPSPAVLVDKRTAITEIENLGEQLKNSRSEKIEAEDEKTLSNGIVVALVGVIGGGVLTMASTGMFGRFDRREKFLAALEREWNLQTQGFDFSTIPKYRRLFEPNANDAHAARPNVNEDH